MRPRSLRIAALLAGTALACLLPAGPAAATVPGQNGPLLVSTREAPLPTDPWHPTYVSHIYRLGLNGKVSKLTMPWSNYSPALSPDGKKLAFVRNPGDQLWLAKVGDLASATRLTEPEWGTYRSDPVFTPDGKSILFATSYENPKDPTFYSELRQIWPGTGELSPEPDGLNQNHQPEISPDGRSIAYSSGDSERSEIRFVEVLGGAERRFPAGMPARGPSFSPDGKRIAYTGKVGDKWQVFTARVDGRGCVQRTFGGKSKYPVQYSPDGTRLAYSTGSHPAFKIRILNLRTGKTRTLEPPGRAAQLAGWSRQRLFRIVGYKPVRRQLRVRVFGSGKLVVRRGRSILGRKTVRRAGTHRLRLRAHARTGKRKVRVTFRPTGALPGTLTYRLKR